MMTTKMKKEGQNAAWNKLSPEARQQLTVWLFDERLGYEEAFKRARAELGYTGSLSSLRRFYYRQERARLMTEFADSLPQVKEIAGVRVSTAELLEANKKALALCLLRQITTSPDKARDWNWLARLVLQGEENGIRAADHSLRQEWLKLGRDRFQIDVVEDAYKALPALRELERTRSSPARTRFEEAVSKLTTLKMMFGSAPNPNVDWATPEELRQIEEASDERVVSIHEAEKRKVEEDAKWKRRDAELAEEHARKLQADDDREEGGDGKWKNIEGAT